jgi:hypothetical protein
VKRHLFNELPLNAQGPRRVRGRVGHAHHFEGDGPLIPVDVNTGESERLQTPIDRCGAANRLQEGVARRVVALDDHQLEELA